MRLPIACPALMLSVSVAACAPPALPTTAPSAPIASATPSDGAGSAKASTESLTIDFGAAGAVLSPEAARQLDGAARLYRDARPEVMIIAGHSDPTGNEYGNLLLSARRAELVKQALANRGIPAERLQIVAIGQAEPVPGVPPTRSVVVTWR